MAKPKVVQAGNTYRFDGVPIRVVFVADDPWFNAADVLDALAAPRSLLDALSDQPGAANVHRDDPIVSETGLHRLLFEADSDAARRFRRWLAAELFPSLYRDEYIARLRSRICELDGLTGGGGIDPIRKHLTDEDRREILELSRAGLTKHAIARKLRRAPNTILGVLRGVSV